MPRHAWSLYLKQTVFSVRYGRTNFIIKAEFILRNGRSETEEIADLLINIGTKCNSLTQQFIRISTTIDIWATCFDSIESSSGPQRIQIQLL